MSKAVQGPTPPQIAQVQSNLKNMQAFNDYVYSQGGNSRILNAYLLLSQKDDHDPGLPIGLNVLEGVFKAIGSMFGPVGMFASNFLSGMLSWWADSANTPPNLNTTFASLDIRIQKTSLQIDTQLATYYQNVADNWNVSFTFDGQTVTMADLSTFQFPPETDPDFEAMAAAAILGMDQMIWTTVLVANYVVTHYIWSGAPLIINGSQNDPPVEWVEMFIGKNPAYYDTWTWHDSQGCGDATGWLINEYNIGTGASEFSDGSMSGSACAYLFIDSADGVVINQNGLFARKTVFNNLGIRQTTVIVPTVSSPPGDKLSKAYLRAMAEGRTLGKLIEREGRHKVERSIIDKAHEDSVFARDVIARPRQTLEKFLGVKIPEVVGLSIVLENGRTFGLVIPEKKE